jgi:hypothetical protein
VKGQRFKGQSQGKIKNQNTNVTVCFWFELYVSLELWILSFELPAAR